MPVMNACKHLTTAVKSEQTRRSNVETSLIRSKLLPLPENKLDSPKSLITFPHFHTLFKKHSVC